MARANDDEAAGFRREQRTSFDLKVRPGIERKNPGDNTSTEVPLLSLSLSLTLPHHHLVPHHRFPVPNGELSTGLVARQLAEAPRFFPSGHE